jgi:hypothetical protein
VAKQSKEGVELLSDGRVKLIIDGDALILRRPKIGELRRFVESLETLTAATPEAKRSFMAGAEDVADWWKTIVAELSDGSIATDVDDLPVWLLAGDLMAQVIAHWREVPFLSGG